MPLAVSPHMFHIIPRALPGRLLFRSWIEADALWRRIIRATPSRVAVFAMPNHVHIQCRRDDSAAIQQAMSGHARWLNHRRGSTGSLFRPLADAEPLGDKLKLRRQERYIHLQACRKGMTTDPLCWPFSTHRDAVGLIVEPVRTRARNVTAYQTYVSGDPSVNPVGTGLPLFAEADLRGPDALPALWAATSAVTRTPEEHMLRRGPARALFLRAARTLTPASTADIAAFAGVCRRVVQRVPTGTDRAVSIVERCAGDRRFPLLRSGDLRDRWPPYSHLR